MCGDHASRVALPATASFPSSACPPPPPPPPPPRPPWAVAAEGRREWAVGTREATDGTRDIVPAPLQGFRSRQSVTEVLADVVLAQGVLPQPRGTGLLW